MNIKSNWDL